MRRLFEGTRWLARVTRRMRRERQREFHRRAHQPLHTRLQRIEQLEERTLLSIGGTAIAEAWGSSRTHHGDCSSGTTL